MFTSDHEAAARELARATAPGGRIALANRTPTGGLAKMFKVMAPYQPAPPPSNPFDWGDEGRARELLGEWFELELDEHVSTLRMPSGEAYWELFSTRYGPTKTLVDSLGDRREELRRDWSTSSRRTTGRTERSPTRASTCSSSGNAAEAGYFARGSPGRSSHSSSLARPPGSGVPGRSRMTKEALREAVQRFER